MGVTRLLTPKRCRCLAPGVWRTGSVGRTAGAGGAEKPDMGYEGDAGSRPCRALRKRVQEQQDRREGAAGRAQGRSDMGPTLQRTEEGEAMGGGQSSRVRGQIGEAQR